MNRICNGILIGLLINTVAIHANVIDEGRLEYSSGSSASYDFIVISLGSNCQPAEFMRTHRIRFFASPFDWCITPYRSLYKVIRTSFKNCIQKNNLEPYAWDSPTVNGILDTKSGIFYNHDFPENTFDAINFYHKSVYEKYRRRINRLFDQIRSGKHVYFIRYLDITKAQACELCQLLKHTFPRIAFTLIVIGNDAAEFEQDWEIHQIKNFFVYCEHGKIDKSMSLEENPFWRELCENIRAGVLRA